MRFGMMLPYDLFADQTLEIPRMLLDAFGGENALFSYLGENLNAIEISPFGSLSDGKVLLSAAKQCIRYGLELTIHGILKEGEPAEKFFAPYLPLFEEGLQKSYNITLHPLKKKEDTVLALTELCDYAEKMDYPITITLENQRLTSEDSVNGICQSVGEIVKAVDSRRLFTCFDFGHHLSNKRKNGLEADPLTEEFFQRIGHTHIHSMCEGTTHFPIDRGETELEKHLAGLLENEYQGILSLEISFPRFAGRIDFHEAICHSVEILKNAYEQTLRKQAELCKYQNHYPEILDQAVAELNRFSCGVALLSPSSYLLKFGDTRIAVDPSLFGLPVSPEGRSRFLEMIASCDAVIYTHKHGDHYDATVAGAIDGENVTWLVPDFFSDADNQAGKFAEKNCVVTGKDQKYRIQDLEISTFESCHSSGDTFIPEYGFTILYEEKLFVFPADVRTYCGLAGKAFPDAEALFAHLWLGRERALMPEGEYLCQFTEFVKGFGAKKVFLGHLFDVRREISDMWTDLHYRLLEGEFENLIPLHLGDVVSLDAKDE